MSIKCYGCSFVHRRDLKLKVLQVFPEVLKAVFVFTIDYQQHLHDVEIDVWYLFTSHEISNIKHFFQALGDFLDLLDSCVL